MEELDLSKEIYVILSNDKRTDGIKSKEELEIILNKTFSGNEIQMNRSEWEKHIPIEKLLMGFRISGGCFVFSRSKFCVSSGMKKTTNVFSIEDFDRVKVVRGGWISDNIELDGKVIGKFNRQSIDPWNRIHNEINSVLKTSFPKNLKEKPKSIEKNKQEVKSKELKPKSDKDCKKKVEDKDQNNTKKIPSQERDKLTLNLDKNGKVTIMEKYDISTVLLKFYKKYKHEKFIRNWEETIKTTKGFFGINFLNHKVGGDGIELKGGRVFTSVHSKDEDFIFSLEKRKVFFYKRFVLIDRNPSLKTGIDYLKVDYSNYNNLKLNYKKTLGIEYPYYKLRYVNNDFSSNPIMDGNCPKIFKEIDSIIRNIDLEDHICSNFIYYQIDLDKNVKDQLQKIKSLKLELIKKFDDCKKLISDIKNTQGKKLDLNKIEIKLNEQKRMVDVNSQFLNDETGISNIKLDLLKFHDLIKKQSMKLQKQQQVIVNLSKELKQLNILKQSQTNVLSELDKDGNGEVDVIEGNDFNLLLKKHQKSIVEVDRTYVQQFVKISGYLKTKEKNIQTIFNLIKDTPNQKVLKEYVEVLKDDIHSYNLILFNSLNMIVSLVEDDMITFYEIHEMFDTLNMFDSKHEKDVSQKLTNIGYGLKDLMYEIRDMGNQISDSIGELSYVTEQSNQQLTNQLSEIDSTMKVGNLINTINTYQNYKNNKNTKSLRG